MSSQHFKNNNISNVLEGFPVLLDQITFKRPIYTAHSFDRVNGQSFRKHLPETLHSPITQFFSDPRIYPSSGKNLIRPCGRKVIASNGRRSYLALLGTPIPHAVSKTKGKAPQEKTIERHEHSENQLTDSELMAMLRDPRCDFEKPYEFQLKPILAAVQELYLSLIAKKKLREFNSRINPLPESILNRLELYTEIPYAGLNDLELRNACNKALRISFGEAKVKEYNVKPLDDNQDEWEPCFLKWPVPQNLLSTELNGKEKAFIKFYLKGNRVRLEIQANSPHRKKDSRQQLAERLDKNVYRSLETETLAVAHIIASCIKTIERHTKAELAKLRVRTPTEKLVSLMKERVGQLMPRMADSTKLIQALVYIAENGHIDRDTYKSIGLNSQGLNRLAHPEFGFLREQAKGLNTGKKRQRLRNPTYILEEENLSRSGRIKPASTKPLPLHVQKTLSLVTKRDTAKFDLMKEAGGAASPSELSRLLGLTGS